jgi:hypothetical protein
MYRNILQRANFGIYILIAVAAAVLQSTLFGYRPLSYLQPDLILILAVFFGFRRDLFEGGIFVIIAAMIMEQHSGSGNNFYLMMYLYSFLIAKLISKLIVVPSMLSSIGIVAALTLLGRLLMLILVQMSGGHPSFLFRHFFISVLPGVLVQIVFTPICFAWFSAIDLKTYKDEHADDEYDINKGF